MSCIRLVNESAYMEIGTTNVSAIIGPYVQSVLTATQKFGIPYFTTDDAPEGHFIPYNLLSVRPRAADLDRLTVDVVRHYRWTSVAVLYDSPAGTLALRPQLHLLRFVADLLYNKLYNKSTNAQQICRKYVKSCTASPLKFTRPSIQYRAS